jgi:hypothetical protein
VPNKASDLRFVPITQTLGDLHCLYTVAEQEEAFENTLIRTSICLQKRGQYVDRNENLLPMLHRVDLSVTQDFSIKIGGKRIVSSLELIS